LSFTNTYYFLALLLAVICFYVIPRRHRTIYLGLLSFSFASTFHWVGAVFLLCSSLFTYYSGKRLMQSQKKGLLVFSICVLLLILFGLKYIGDGRLAFNRKVFQVDVSIVFIGLSYYTLQNIAFLLNVYWQRIQQFNSFPLFFLFNAFFPKLVSGPIEDYTAFQKQIDDLPSKALAGDLTYGIQRILVGLFKKLVLADRLAPAVALVFQDSVPNNGLTTWIGVCLFTFQLYFDFSALIDIALGSARCFGIKLSENFDLPLRSASLTSLWRSWHMTLISWLTQYLYYPVVYRFRASKYVGIVLGINVVFLMSAIWHGWGITFLLWGFWNALVVCLELFGKKVFPKSLKIPGMFKVIYCFSVFSFGLLFFRAQSLTQIRKLIDSLFGTSFLPKSWLYDCLAVLAGGGAQELLFNFFLVLTCLVVFLVFEKRIYAHFFSTKWRTVGNVLLLSSIVVLGLFEFAPQFIYLQF